MAIPDSIAFLTATLASNTLTVANPSPILVITLSAESGTADTLTTVTTPKTGQIIILFADSTDTITVTRGTTIKGPTATYSLSGERCWIGVYNGTYLREISRSPNA